MGLRAGGRIYISVTAKNGDEVNFTRDFNGDDGMWTEGKRMLATAIEAVLGPAVIAEDKYREEESF